MNGKRGGRRAPSAPCVGSAESGAGFRKRGEALSCLERFAVFFAASIMTVSLITGLAWAGPVGDLIEISAWTPGAGAPSPAAIDAVGNFVIAWNSYGPDGDGEGVFAQLYDASGVARGSEFQVNTFTTGYQLHPSAAMEASGKFVIAWVGDEQDGHLYGVLAQRYDAAGVAQGSEFLVNTCNIRFQVHPSVAMDASGNFVIAWMSAGEDGSGNSVCAQRYDASGMALGGEFRVNTFTKDSQDFPSLAMNASGNSVVAWRSADQDGDLSGVFAQRYGAACVPQGGEFQVNTYTYSAQREPSVAIDPSGNFVIVWHSYQNDGSYYGVFAQRYDAAGVAQGSEFQVNTYWVGTQIFPDVAVDALGNFVVTWKGSGSDGSGVYAQRYDATGVAQGWEFKVSTDESSPQGVPLVAMCASGSFIISWRNRNVFAQRYDLTPPPAPVIATNDGQDFTVGISPFTLEGTTTAFTAEMWLNGSRITSYTPGSTEWSVDVDLAGKASVLSVTVVDMLGFQSAAATVTITYDTENDADRDGILDREEGQDDPDEDGLDNYIDSDSDGDGVYDITEAGLGTDPYDTANPTEAPIAWWPIAFALLAASLVVLRTRRKATARQAKTL